MSVVIVCHAEDCPSRKSVDRGMRLMDETAHAFIFQCRTCLNIRAVSKDKVGGTIGAGRRDDVPPSRFIGRGMDREAS